MTVETTAKCFATTSWVSALGLGLALVLRNATAVELLAAGMVVSLVAASRLARGRS